MNFFRLRALNTFLFFFVGIILGFILKGKFYPARPPAVPGSYQSPYSPQVPAGREEDEEPAPEEDPYLEEEPAPGARAVPPAAELVLEPPVEPVRQALRGEEDAFFATPARYEGRELEMDLQMITARRGSSGWRLNLVYSGRARKIDYLYVEDDSLLGLKPDLRIGYVYKVRFRCGKGSVSSGNALLSLKATGGKADWATGLSAVE